MSMQGICFRILARRVASRQVLAPGLVAWSGSVLAYRPFDGTDAAVDIDCAATATWLDAASFETRAVFKSGPKPNSAAIVKRAGVGVVACIGDAREAPTLHAIDLKGGGSVRSICRGGRDGA
jgi:hypothetical protein